MLFRDYLNNSWKINKFIIVITVLKFPKFIFISLMFSFTVFGVKIIISVPAFI